MNEIKFSFWMIFTYILFPFGLLSITWLNFILHKPGKEGGEN